MVGHKRLILFSKLVSRLVNKIILDNENTPPQIIRYLNGLYTGQRSDSTYVQRALTFAKSVVLAVNHYILKMGTACACFIMTTGKDGLVKTTALHVVQQDGCATRSISRELAG